MENKCNKTPNNNNKYLDHVYCHPSDGKNYIRANNAGGGGGGGATAGADLLALLKENKQLKGMLLLHLDLIQAQSDQLMTKDKQLSAQSAELETLRTRNAQLEAQMQELQKQRQRQLKRSAVSPPPLAKIQRKELPTGIQLASATPATANGNASGSGLRNVIGECNGKLISKIILHRVSLPERSPNSTTASDTTSEADDNASKTHHEHTEHDDDDDEEADEAGGAETTGNTTEDSNDAIAHSQRLRCRVTPSLNVARGAKPLRALRPPVSTSTTAISGGSPAMTKTTAVTQVAAVSKTPANVGAAVTPVQVCVTPPTPSRGKQMPLMLWHAPEMHSDESASCDSMAETDQRSTTGTSPASITLSNKAKRVQGESKHSVSHAHHQHHVHHHAKSRRCAYISTPHMYCTREWEDDEFLCDYEFIKEEANALHADAPMLEIPKWTEHELTVSYCIEGTEDLSDETFLKRHAKLEADEKRRKKWDVQQIREQRRIEKLKRRHCKDEIQVPPEQQPLVSFYPQADAIQTICFVSDVPVQAFGEVVPKPNLSTDFMLPWMDTAATTTTASSVATLTRSSLAAMTPQAQQQLLNSTFVFLKKRKRQQSASNVAGATARQRSVAAAKAAAIATATTTHSTSATTTTTAPMTTACTTTSTVNSETTK